MSISETVIEEYVKDLLEAENTQVPIEPITKKYQA